MPGHDTDGRRASGIAGPLREARLRRSMSQEDLAEAAGLSVRTIRNIELGSIARPHRSSLALIAEALGMDLAELRSSVGPPRGWAPATPPPRQLPPDVAGFTGRIDHLRQLDAALTVDPLDRTALVLLTVVGAPGSGKTALAVRWAHRVADRFPDGQLFVDLRGFSPGAAASPAAVLSAFLRGLGVAPQSVPVDGDEAAALYRSMLADRRVLIVLDNAAGARQVRPLLPGGSTCAVLVTSRHRLDELTTIDGARIVPLGPLTAVEARALLGRMVGADRVARERRAAEALADACGRLPLALRLAATTLAGAPHQSIEAYLTTLRTGESPSAGPDAVGGAFESSYRRLDTGGRRLLRLLSLVPGPTFTGPVAAALAGWPAQRARLCLDRLAEAHLIAGCAPGRFAFHDLMRTYATEHCHAEEDAQARHTALLRLFDHYLRHADVAARVLHPQKLRLPASAARPEPEVSFDGPADCLAWLTAEQANLVAATVLASETAGGHTLACGLADALRGHLHSYAQYDDLYAVGTAAVAASRAAADPHARVVGEVAVAQCHDGRRQWHRAVSHYRDALAAARAARWNEGIATCLGNLGGVYWDMGELAKAAALYDDALRLNRRTGWVAGEAVNLKNLAIVLRESGQPRQAAAHLRRCLRLYRKIGAPHGEAGALISIGNIQRDLGRPAAARRYLVRGLEMERALDNRSSQSTALESLAAVAADGGNYRDAIDQARTALTLAREESDARAEIDALHTLASVYLRTGRGQDALDHYGEALRLARLTPARYCEATALLGLGDTHHHLGRNDLARHHAEAALDIAQRHGYRAIVGDAKTVLAAVSIAQGQTREAVADARTAVDIHRRTGCRLAGSRASAVLRACLEDGRGAADPRAG